MYIWGSKTIWHNLPSARFCSSKIAPPYTPHALHGVGGGEARAKQAKKRTMLPLSMQERIP